MTPRKKISQAVRNANRLRGRKTNLRRWLYWCHQEDKQRFRHGKMFQKTFLKAYHQQTKP